MVTTATRANTRRATLNKIIKNVMEIEDDHVIHKALAYHGINSIPNIVSLSEADILTLQYEDRGDTITLLLRTKNMICISKV